MYVTRSDRAMNAADEDVTAVPFNCFSEREELCETSSRGFQ